MRDRPAIPQPPPTRWCLSGVLHPVTVALLIVVVALFLLANYYSIRGHGMGARDLDAETLWHTPDAAMSVGFPIEFYTSPSGGGPRFDIFSFAIDVALLVLALKGTCRFSRWLIPHLRFCLRTLVLFVLLMGAGMLAWTDSDWRCVHQITREAQMVEFSPRNDGTFLTLEYGIGEVKIWDIGAPTNPKVTLQTKADQIYGAVFSRDGRYVFTVSQTSMGGRVVKWSADTGAKVSVLASSLKGFQDVSVSEDGRYLAFAERDSVTVLDLETEQTVFSQTGVGQHASLSPSGDLLAVSNLNPHNELLVFDTKNGRRLHTIDMGEFSMHVQFSKDGTKALVGNWWSLQSWDLRSGQKLHEYEVQGVLYPRYAADEDWILAPSRGRLHILDARTGNVRWTLPWQRKMGCADLSRDRKCLITAGGAPDGVRIWRYEGCAIGPFRWVLLVVIAVGFAWSLYRDIRTRKAHSNRGASYL